MPINRSINEFLSVNGHSWSDVRDATDALTFTVPDDPIFLRGCVIGDGSACTGSKAVRMLEGVSAAYIGAAAAYVIFDDGRVLRYDHAGIIPKAQDRLTMPPPGSYKLRPPRKSNSLGKPQGPSARAHGAKREALLKYKRPQSGNRYSPQAFKSVDPDSIDRWADGVSDDPGLELNAVDPTQVKTPRTYNRSVAAILRG